MRLGKLPAIFGAQKLALSNIIGTNIPTPPSSVDYYSLVTSWPLMLNDTMDDCAIAAAGHMIQQWTINSKGVATIIPNSDVQSTYETFVGQGNDNQPVHLSDVLDYWANQGITISGQGIDKILGYALLDQKNQAQVQSAVYSFGNCMIGLVLPDAVKPTKSSQPNYNQYTNSAGQIEYGKPWDDSSAALTPNSNNGHCVPAVGYDANNLYVVTWGALIPMSWKFYFTFMDEAYALLSPDWIKANPPSGFDITSLLNVLSNISPPSRNDIKVQVLGVLNAIMAPTGNILPNGSKSIPNTASAESLTLWPDCGFSALLIGALAPDLNKIATNPAYPNGKAITDTSGLKTVGDAITLTWNRAKGYTASPAVVGVNRQKMII